MRANKVAALIALSLCVAAAAFGQPLAANSEDIAEVFRALQAPGATEPPAVFTSEEGYLRFLGAPPGGYFANPGVAKGSGAEAAARGFVDAHQGAFGVTSGHVALSVKNVQTHLGESYVRLKQSYGGVPVFGGSMVVQVNDDGGIKNVASEILRDTRPLDYNGVSLTPSLSEADAITAAKNKLAAALGTVTADALTVQEGPELVIYSPTLLGMEGQPHLAWRMVLASEGAEAVRENVFIDAHSGELTFHYSLIYNAKARKIYDLKNTYTVPATPAREEGDPAVGITDVDNVYDYLGDTYDFYFSHHGRDSYDDDGGEMIARVRDASEAGNASWNGSFMKYGTGYGVDDVTAHELTHGVTQYTSDLIYLGESGAINECFSDSWGEFVDLTNGKGDDSAAVRWIIAEDLSDFVGGDPSMGEVGIRSMKDPTLFNDPDRYTSPYLINPENWWRDLGGVHTNCGVGNKLTYLLTDGDTFNGQTVTGMGIDRTANLLYACQYLLPAYSTYYMYYFVLGAASANLGFSFDERLNIVRATRAVEIEPPDVLEEGLRGFRAVPATTMDGDAVIALNWTPPASDTYSQVVLVRSVGAYASSLSDGTQLYAGREEKYLDEAVNPGTVYYYTLFANMNSGFPQMAYARATAGGQPSKVLTESFNSAYTPTRLDLAYTQITFTPVGSPPLDGGGSGGNDYSDYEATIMKGVVDFPVPMEDALGGPIMLPFTDDGMFSFGLGNAAFPFFGKRYSIIALAANGYIAFQEMDPYSDSNFPSLAAHFEAPRISFLFADLAPIIGGTAWARELPDRMVATYEEIPEYIYSGDYSSPLPNSVQVELFFSGHIRITYKELNAKRAVAGLSDGQGVPQNPGDLFEDLRNVNFYSDLSELPEAPSQLSIDPVALQEVDAGALISFTVTTTKPAGAEGIPILFASWDGAGNPPFADAGDGTGTFYWQTTPVDAGVYTLRVRTMLGDDDAYQDVLLVVGDMYLLPEARNLLLSTGAPGENPALNRVVDDDRPLMASYDYYHPQAEEDPALFGEGPTIIYWYKNGQIVTAYTGSLTVPASATRGNDRWWFRVLPITASYTEGNEAISPIVTIINLPEVLSVTPNFGQELGGETIRVVGASLNGAYKVKFGGVSSGRVTAIDKNTLEVVTPLHMAGTVDVTVTTNLGTGRLAGAFTYQAPPEEPEVKTITFMGCGPGWAASGGRFGDMLVVVMMAAVLALALRWKRERAD